jgi:hypothetical protein
LVPGRLKFWSSCGPIAFVAGVLVGSVVFWANAEAGKSQSPPAIKTVFPRKIALIVPAVLDTPLVILVGANGAMPAAWRLFKQRLDERKRNPASFP